VCKEFIMTITSSPNTDSLSREIRSTVRGSWWTLLFAGILGIVAGVIILAMDWTVSDLAIFVGLLLFLRGLFTMFGTPFDGAMRGWSIFLGILEMAVGVAVFVWPAPTLLVIGVWIGWYVLFSGVFTIAGAISSRKVFSSWGLALALGILEVIFSFWLLARPDLTLMATVYAIGIWSIVYGVMEMVFAFQIKNAANELLH
jgi:uncharacterized membrane protein HdeD (DUF308 family)